MCIITETGMNNTSYHHASCGCINGRAVLILGPSGAGKSDLLIRLIHQGAELVADDQVILSKRDNRIFASAPGNIRGLIEMRGVGVISLPNRQDMPLALAIQLVERKDVPRLPEPAFFDCFAVQVPLLSLHAFDESVCAKIFLYMASLKP